MLKVTDLHVTYGSSIRALSGVSLDVSEGSVVAVLGANGAGKSTLMRSLSGTLVHHRGRVTAGAIEFRGQDLLRMRSSRIVRAGMAQSPEGRRVFTKLTVEENLRVAASGARTSGRRASQLREVAWELFPRLEERKGQAAGLLSGGEQQMLAIARALMAEPSLLLLDEPSLGLAPQMVEAVGAIIEKIHAGGTTVLLVEQNAAMALAVSSQAVVLGSGTVCGSGPSARMADSGEVRDLYLGGGASPPSPDPVRPTQGAGR